MKEQDNLQHRESEQFISKRMIIKIGSSSITKNGDPLNLEFMSNIAQQCAQLYKAGVEIAIVSSGAVATGKKILQTTENDIIHDQVAAIYGQSILMDAWKDVFGKENINVGQVLISEDDLSKPNTPLVEGLKHGIQIINANDAVNDIEMKAYFLSSDNDKLAGHVAKFIQADTLLLLTDVDGVLDKNGIAISELHPGQELNLTGKSDAGTGGMVSKVAVGFESSQHNIRTIIANAYEQDVILKVAREKKIGTKFVID